jgi:putative transposase
MKKSRFAEQQIADALKKSVLGTKIEEICRKMGNCDAAFYDWSQKHG